MLPWLLHVWAAFLAVVEHANPGLLFAAVAFLPLAGVPASPLLIAGGVRLGTATPPESSS